LCLPDLTPPAIGNCITAFAHKVVAETIKAKEAASAMSKGMSAFGRTPDMIGGLRQQGVTASNGFDLHADGNGTAKSVTNRRMFFRPFDDFD
jgi:hypothetical protein